MKTASACLWDGKDLPAYSAGKYGPEDAIRLCENFRRHVPQDEGFEFLLFVDAHFLNVMQQVQRPAEMKLIPIMPSPLGGWTPVFSAFHPDFTPPGSRTVLVGLDTVIMNDPSWLWDWDHAPVGLPLDPYFPDEVCDAVVSFTHEGALLVWGEYQRACDDGSMGKDYCMGKRPSEMILLRHMRKGRGWTTFHDTGDQKKLLSYKVDVLNGGRDPSRATLVYFHGNPKVWHLDQDDLVKKEWERE